MFINPHSLRLTIHCFHLFQSLQLSVLLLSVFTHPFTCPFNSTSTSILVYLLAVELSVASLSVTQTARKWSRPILVSRSCTVTEFETRNMVAWIDQRLQRLTISLFASLSKATRIKIKLLNKNYQLTSLNVILLMYMKNEIREQIRLLFISFFMAREFTYK